MARHLVAVCVVCLLCAEHFPCKGHIEGKENIQEDFIKYSKDSRIAYLTPMDRDEYHDKGNYENEKINNVNQGDDRRDINKRGLERLKRHAHHEQTSVQNNLEIGSSSKQYLEKLFTMYGDPQSKTMTLDRFEHMLNNLGLKQLISEKLSIINDRIVDTTTEGDQKHSCLSSVELVQRVTGKGYNIHEHEKHSPDAARKSQQVDQIHHHHLSPYEHYHEHDSHEQTAKNASGLLKSKIGIDFSMMWDICPILLYQVASSNPDEKSGCITDSQLPKHDHFTHYVASLDSFNHPEDRGLVWMYATLAIFGVSLCGLLGVAVIPCMDKHFYHHALQFFVALAVGTLCGDALLHLLPHSMIGHPGGDAGHEYMTYKGLTAVLGIVFFYFVERALTIIAGRWAKHQKKGKLPSRIRVIRDPDFDPENAAPNDMQCKHKYSSYPYCYNEIAMETKDDHHEHPVCSKSVEDGHNHNSVIQYSSCPNHKEHVGHHQNQNDSEQKLLDSHNNYTISGNYKHLCNSYSREPCDSVEKETVTSVENSSVDENTIKKQAKALLPEENYTIILREHENKHHGHSHTHGHVHSPPDSLSAVAWMVIMGDGLHNFTDGMAIGAAFSNNIAGGFSTAIAVFCHELPHELGDFAVLLKAGMTAKQAVFYNILSSILSFFGMVVGVMVGDTPEASAWIFACAAGMFLYIALVDMIPELTSSHNGKEERCQLSESVLQFAGMAVGFGIMLLISIYEHDLKDMFSSQTNLNDEHK